MLILGGLLLIVAVVGLVLEPLLRGHRASMEREDDELSEAESVRRVKLLALRDTEYDWQMGKLDEEDYRSLRSQLSAEALEAMKTVEEEEGTEVAQDSEAELEAEIAAVRAGIRVGTTCSICGSRNPRGSRFCGGCGVALETADLARS